MGISSIIVDATFRRHWASFHGTWLVPSISKSCYLRCGGRKILNLDQARTI